MIKKNAKIYVAGHQGLVGRALVRKLLSQGYKNLILKTRQELDLLNAKKVGDFFKREKPEYVFLAAAKVGGIMANFNYPAEFIYENLTVQNNVIHNSYLSGVKKLLFLGSSCIYPRLSPQPIKEEYLLTSEPESTNEPYVIAKIAGVITCQSYNRQYGTNFISVMPTNLYGPNDNFDLNNSHVFPGLIRKIHDAKEAHDKEIVIWGTGKPKREFLHVDDLADARLHLMNKYDGSDIINIGTGEDISIKDFAELVRKIVGFKGKIVWDKTKPDGTPRKLLDVSKLHALNWKHKIGVEEGIKITYSWFKNNYGGK